MRQAGSHGTREEDRWAGTYDHQCRQSFTTDRPTDGQFEATSGRPAEKDGPWSHRALRLVELAYDRGGLKPSKLAVLQYNEAMTALRSSPSFSCGTSDYYAVILDR